MLKHNHFCISWQENIQVFRYFKGLYSLQPLYLPGFTAAIDCFTIVDRLCSHRVLQLYKMQHQARTLQTISTFYTVKLVEEEDMEEMLG